MYTFRIYWLSGSYIDVKGESFRKAYTNAGYTRTELLFKMDYYEKNQTKD